MKSPHHNQSSYAAGGPLGPRLEAKAGHPEPSTHRPRLEPAPPPPSEPQPLSLRLPKMARQTVSPRGSPLSTLPGPPIPGPSLQSGNQDPNLCVLSQWKRGMQMSRTERRGLAEHCGRSGLRVGEASSRGALNMGTTVLGRTFPQCWKPQSRPHISLDVEGDGQAGLWVTSC